MRHRNKGVKLGRNTSQRKALFRSLISSLIINEEIKTTETKAKVVKRLVDKLISKAKVGSLHVRRQILAFISNKRAVNKLIDDIAPRFKGRSGGFTKFTRLGRRLGDNASLAKLELLEKKKEESVNKKDKESKIIKKTKRIKKEQH